VATLLGTILLLLFGLAVGGPLIALRYARLASAEQQARKQAKAAQEQAETSRQELLSLLTETLTTTIESLENTPSIDPVHRDLLDDTPAQYEKLLQQSGDDPAVRFEAGKAFCRLGWVLQLRSDANAAERIAVAIVFKVPNDVDRDHRLTRRSRSM
jgi:hypothetical protein